MSDGRILVVKPAALRFNTASLDRGARPTSTKLSYLGGLGLPPLRADDARGGKSLRLVNQREGLNDQPRPVRPGVPFILMIQLNRAHAGIPR